MPTDGTNHQHQQHQQQQQQQQRDATETHLLLPDPSTPPPPPPQTNVLPNLLTAILLFFTAVAMTIPIRPQLILHASSTPSQAQFYTSSVESLQSILSIFLSPLLGTASDITGRKPILLITHFGEFLSLFIISLFPTSLLAQFPAYLLTALTAAYFVAVNTIIADISTDVIETSSNYGYIGAAFGVSLLIGPILGGIIEDSFYSTSSLHLACIIIIISAFFIHHNLPETKPSTHTPTFTQILHAVHHTDLNPFPRISTIFAHNSALTWIALTISATAFAESGFRAILIIFATVQLDWGTKETGTFLSAIGLSVIISQTLLAQSSVRLLGETPTILLGYSLAILHYLAFAFAKTSAMMYVGVLIGMFAAIAAPTMKGLLARQVSKDMQGALQGSVSALTAVTRPAAPMLVAACYTVGIAIGRPGLPFLVIAFVSALSLACARIAFWKPGLK